MRKLLTMVVGLGLLAASARLAAQPPDVKPGPEHAGGHPRVIQCIAQQVAQPAAGGARGIHQLALQVVHVLSEFHVTTMTPQWCHVKA